MPRPLALLTALVTLLSFCASLARAADRYLYIQPLGPELPDEDVRLVAAALTQFYGVPLRVQPRLPLPPGAYYPARGRYRAERLLDFLRGVLPKDGVRVLGLTAVDISTSKGRYADWGVLGLGSIDGASGVISTFRCHRGARNALHARQRLAKVAVHEIGHTLGLQHCPSDGCIMHDAEGKVATTDHEYDLCPRCRALLKDHGVLIPAAPAIPWPRPPS